jgi:class 3 adenylate cyclase
VRAIVHNIFVGMCSLSKLGIAFNADIGDFAVGHRRKLLNAIAALSEPAATAHSPRPEAAPPIVTVRPSAERRQLTVMFCDLVGSTTVSTQVDLYG